MPKQSPALPQGNPVSALKSNTFLNTYIGRLKALARRRNLPDEVKSFRQIQQTEGASETLARGRQQVPLDRICGSVGRYRDFDHRFKPKPHLGGERYEQTKAAMRAGRPLPPVDLYQFKDDYYVFDGNHRIAAAKALGWQDIAARILEIIPSGNRLEDLLYRQRAEFSKRTGLPYTITLTEVGQYDLLWDQIVRHHAHLTHAKPDADPDVTFTAAALDWYTHIYRPLMAIIRATDLLKYFPKRTLDDLYAYISFHQWGDGRKRKFGIGIDRLIPTTMEAFREKMADNRTEDYPEMLRQITAFVLMNVRAKNETRILEKLFALKEVQEVHSIHGNVDVLVKIILTRDLLSSDAEIISEFVNTQLRPMAGIISTQTLIPGQSLIKDHAKD